MDWDEVKEFVLGGLLILIGMAFFMAAIITPIMYLEGSAKSSWIKEQRGISMPWYKAAFLDIQINEVKGEIK